MKLEDFTMKQVTDYLIGRISENRDIPKTVARKLFINALLYNVVIAEIDSQIDFLLENLTEENDTEN